MLKDKVAVVTGGTRGIGEAICKAFAKNGASVAFLYSGSIDRAAAVEEELKALGVNAKGYQCNVAVFEETQKTFKTIIKDFGRVDILVNNAGITRDKIVMMMRPNDFDEVIDVNLKGAFNMIKQAYPVFLKQKSGKIINISSVTGLMGNTGQANYSASKAGLIGLTKSVARELAGRGICCNAIAPGFIQTDMTSELSGENPLIDSIPAKRLGNPSEVASLAVFLASDNSNYITGEVIRIDGGLAM